MKKFLIAAALAIALTGCAGTDLGRLGSVLTAQVGNPITRVELKAILQTEITTKKFAIRYLRLPTCAPDKAPWPANNCGDYQLRLNIQSSIARAIPVRKELIHFVRENDTVNARVAYDELQRIIGVYNQVRG